MVENFDPYQDFSKILTKFEIFRKLDKNREFSKTLTKINILVNLD